MEDMMALMMMTETHENTRDLCINDASSCSFPSSSSSSPLASWKLYDNPFYYYSQQQHLRAPILSTFLCSHLTLFPPMVPPSSLQSEMDLARAQIEELKAEIEFERRMRKKAESTNKRLAKELMEARKKHEAVARLCEELAEEVGSKEVVIDGMKKDMEEERKMMRIAQVWREERVQMKLEEARILMEKKMLQERERDEEKTRTDERREDTSGISDLMTGMSGNSGSSIATENKVRSTSQRRGSPEAENPHIRRGIKGFVEEFPRAVRAVGSRGRQTGSNLECQRAQLRLLLRHKNPVGLSVAGADNLNVVV